MATIVNGRVKLNNGQMVTPQTGEWYDAQQFWNGTLSSPGQINPLSNQQGAGQQVSQQVVAQTNPNNYAYIQQQQSQPQSQPINIKTPANVNISPQLAQPTQPSSSIAQSPSLAALALQMQQNQQQQVDLAKQAYGLQKSQLESQVPGVESRYQQLLKDITTQSTRATSQEYSRRGIPLSSGIYEQGLAQAIEPQTERLGLAKEQDLTNLRNQISNVGISEAQSMGDYSTTALNNAMQLYQLEQQANQQAQAQEQANREWEYQQKMYNYELNRPYYSPNTGTQADRETAIKQKLLQAAGQGVTLPDLVKQFGGQVDINELVKLYTGVNYYKKPPEEDWARKILGLDIGSGATGGFVVK